MRINIHGGFVNISEDTFAADNNAGINIQGGAVLNIGKGGGLVRLFFSGFDGRGEFFCRTATAPSGRAVGSVRRRKHQGGGGAQART